MTQGRDRVTAQVMMGLLRTPDGLWCDSWPFTL